MDCHNQCNMQPMVIVCIRPFSIDYNKHQQWRYSAISEDKKQFRLRPFEGWISEHTSIVGEAETDGVGTTAVITSQNIAHTY